MGFLRYGGVGSSGCRDRDSQGCEVPGLWDRSSEGMWSPKGMESRYVVSWGNGTLGLRDAESRGCRVPGHEILSLEDPGYTRVWTHGSRAHGVWATEGLCPGTAGHAASRAWEVAELQCSGTRVPGQAVTHPRARPGWAQPGLCQFLACSLPAPVGGSDGAWHCPCASARVRTRVCC